MKVAEFDDPELTEAVRAMLDAFSGADGGVVFVLFCNLLREAETEHIGTTLITHVIQLGKVFRALEGGNRGRPR